jgi:hypothetical protein
MEVWMSWSDENYRHEGALSPVFADGAWGGGSTSLAIFVSKAADGRRVWGVDEWRSYRDVTGWRVVCDCVPSTVRDEELLSDEWSGHKELWMGPLWERVPRREQEDLAARRIYCLDENAADLADDRPDIYDLAKADWDLHAAPDVAVAAVRTAAVAVREATQRLTDAVQRARDAGASWAVIGTAAGISRQSAHERWGR